MDAFVEDLTRIYRLAAATPIQEFPGRALGLLREWIDFDGAVFGFGETTPDRLSIDGVCIYHRAPALLTEYAEVSRLDPVTRSFVRRPRSIQNVDTEARYAGKENDLLARFARCHDLRHLLLVGDQNELQSRLRWIVLYRGTHKSFEPFEVIRMSAAWEHIRCALDLNRAHELDLHAPPGDRRALALVSPAGVFELVDQAFLDVLRREWRDLPDTRLPLAALGPLQSGRPFTGRQVEIAFIRRGDHILCEARGLEAHARLSAREGQVATYYSIGKSYKEIAKLLGSSPNTVRVQLARIYQKLGIKDKSVLASALTRRAEGSR
ncbi:MAG: helix-turn-helix transcriptional regulator [Holophaga sp.]|nr:helix-turn-helix transcriptional regulator [Holophaga sp.]